MLCLDPIPDCYWEPVQLKTWAVPYRTTGGKEPALTIAAVGAVYQPAYGFSANDRGWLDDTIAVLTQRGTLDMARDVHVAPVNFLCGRNALGFRASARKCLCAVLSAIRLKAVLSVAPVWFTPRVGPARAIGRMASGARLRIAWGRRPS